MASMIDRPKEQDQIDMVLRNLQPRFARRLVGIPFQDLRTTNPTITLNVWHTKLDRQASHRYAIPITPSQTSIL